MATKTGWNRLWHNLQRVALEELDHIHKQLPLVLRDKALSLPVTLEPKPSLDLIRDGLEPELLGLYIGETFAESLSGGDELPSQIFLFLENIWDYVGHDTADYREEVRITYLHELGHYLGLDEDDLAVRDLD